jgi:predicted RNase H-like nuclease (RuvC/YqgF family)
VSVKLAKGVMHINRKLSRSKKYTVKNSDSKTKTVLVEYPLDASWKLIAPEKPAEKTRDRYRFAVTAVPGKPATLDVHEEQVVSQQLALTNVDDGAIAFYISQKAVAQEVKAALQEVVKRKQAIEQLVRERSQLEQQIGAITQEQERIRENMGRLDRNSDLYKRYVQKFGTQEDQIEKMRERIQSLTADETRLRKTLDDYLINLEVG